MSLETILNELGKSIQESLDNAHELGSIRATLLVNFGPTSLSKQRYGFEIATEGPENTDSTQKILYAVLKELTSRISNK